MVASALIRILYLALMFIAGLVLSNIALPESFGTISLIILNASLFSIVTSLGADTMILYKVSNGDWGQAKAAKFTKFAIVVQLFLFFLMECLSLTVWRTTLLSNKGANFLLHETAYFTGLLLTEKYLALLYAFHRSRIANILLALGAFSYLALLLVVQFLISPDIQTVMGLFVGQSLVQGLILLIVFYVKQKPIGKESLHLKEFFSLLRLSSIVMITNVIQLFAYRLDFWIIQFYWGRYDVGIYAQANKFANLCWIVPNIFAQLLLPKFATLRKEQTQGVFSCAFYFNLILLLTTTISAHLFYAFYLKPEYSVGIGAFHLMLPGYFFWACVIYFAAFVSSAGKFSYNLVCSSTCLIIVFLADMALIPLLGIEGAALANSISYTAVFFIYLYIMVRKFAFGLNDLFWLRKNVLAGILKFVNR